MNVADRLNAAQAAHIQLVTRINNVKAKLRDAEANLASFRKQLDEEEASRQTAITSGKYAFLRSLNSVASKLSDASADVASYKRALGTLNEQLTVAAKELTSATNAERDVRRRAAVAKMAVVLRGPFATAHDELLAIWDEEQRGDSFLLIDKALLETYLAASDSYVAGPKPPPPLRKGHVLVRFVQSFEGQQVGDNLDTRLRYILPYPQGTTASFSADDAKALIKAGYCEAVGA